MCMLACTIGDEHQNHRLKASSLQRLSAMVWFMSEFSHIFDHFDKVVAVTVFFLLSVAFYAFFAPFPGKDIYEYFAIGIYSFLALCVFILYTRCTSINPADPGILIEADKSSTSRSNNETDIPAIGLFKMLMKYRPEDRAQKKEGVLKRAQAEAEGKTPEIKKPIIVNYGLNHITYLIEQNKV